MLLDILTANQIYQTERYKELDCALINDSNHAKFKFKVVSNSEDGFIALIDWLSKHIKSTAPEYHLFFYLRTSTSSHVP
jgi:hypothetical protein